MRTHIVHPGAEELNYEIRGIVEVAGHLKAAGQNITWENIGDPVAKGETVPEWIRNIVQKHAANSSSYAYSPTKGILKTREYIAKERNLEGGLQITAEDILFTNGLGDAISKIYDNLHPDARIIGPNPAYPTHSSAEAAHSGSAHITYPLDPKNNWKPDLQIMEEKIKSNKNISGVIIINPDNPTGYVYSPDTLRQIVEIAKKYNLFIIADEIYSNLSFPDSGMQKLASVIGGVPAISMRGISKEFPWPGSRCGWLEFYNRDADPNFDKYVQSIINAKMLEVCSTTLPQTVIPEVMQDSRYFPYLEKRIAKYQRRSDYATKVLGDIPNMIIHPAKGAFYLTAVFKEGLLKSNQKLRIDNPKFKQIISLFLEKNMTLDKRFVYFLLASTGICVVPLASGFNSDKYGFRITLLEENEDKFKETVNTIAEAVREYLGS